MADELLNGLMSVDDVAARWGCATRTIYKLIERKILPSVDVPGKRGQFIRNDDVRRIESELKKGKQVTPDQNEKRICDVWQAFERHLSPLSQYRKAMAMALTQLLHTDSQFGLDDADAAIEQFIAAKTTEYDDVVRATEERESRDRRSPDLQRMVDSRPGNEPSRGPAPELKKMFAK